MTFRRVINLIILIVSLMLSSVTIAAPVDVGTGSNTAYVYIEWSDSYVAEYNVRFPDTSITSLGLLDIIEANTNLVTVRKPFGASIFLDGFTLDTHSDIGYGGDEDWWHYWTKDIGQADWTMSGYAVNERVIYDGYRDGWIYGRAGAVPEPATVMLLAFGGLMLRKRK